MRESLPRKLFKHHFGQTDISNFKTSPQCSNLEKQEALTSRTPSLPTHPLLAEVKRQFTDEGGLTRSSASRKDC